MSENRKNKKERGSLLMNGDRNAPRHQKTPDRRGRAKIKRESVGGEGARMKKK